MSAARLYAVAGIAAVVLVVVWRIWAAGFEASELRNQAAAAERLRQVNVATERARSAAVLAGEREGQRYARAMQALDSLKAEHGRELAEIAASTGESEPCACDWDSPLPALSLD